MTTRDSELGTYCNIQVIRTIIYSCRMKTRLFLLSFLHLFYFEKSKPLFLAFRTFEHSKVLPKISLFKPRPNESFKVISFKISSYTNVGNPTSAVMTLLMQLTASLTAKAFQELKCVIFRESVLALAYCIKRSLFSLRVAIHFKLAGRR